MKLPIAVNSMSKSVIMFTLRKTFGVGWPFSNVIMIVANGRKESSVTWCMGTKRWFYVTFINHMWYIQQEVRIH